MKFEVWTWFTFYSLQSTVYSLQFTVSTVYGLHSLQSTVSTVYSLQSTVCSLQSTVYRSNRRIISEVSQSCFTAIYRKCKGYWALVCSTNDNDAHLTTILGAYKVSNPKEYLWKLRLSHSLLPDNKWNIQDRSDSDTCKNFEDTILKISTFSKDNGDTQ